jgi:hypothetical protein
MFLVLFLLRLGHLICMDRFRSVRQGRELQGTTFLGRAINLRAESAGGRYRGRVVGIGWWIWDLPWCKFIGSLTLVLSVR